MLREIDNQTFNDYFPVSPHPFLTGPFIELNKAKVERIVRLVAGVGMARIGLIAGVKNKTLLCPFSAPFGGFHFKSEIIYISEIDCYLCSLQEYIKMEGLDGIKLILPPDIYHPTFNAKVVNSLIRNGFKMITPDITGSINLPSFNGTSTQKSSLGYYKQAVRNNLLFKLVCDINSKEEVYNLIWQNRLKFNRPIYMTFKDILDTSKLWPVDFFKVINDDLNLLAGAIIYRNHNEICYVVFWADNEIGRPLRAMDFLVLNLILFYKNMRFKFLQVGTATEDGIPNEGLLRFKECHGSTSSLRYRFTWNPKE